MSSFIQTRDRKGAIPMHGGNQVGITTRPPNVIGWHSFRPMQSRAIVLLETVTIGRISPRVSTRQKKSRIDVLQLTRRVRSMYASLHDDEDIEFEIDDTTKVVAETTESALLQCIINLVDNATYWLMTSPRKPRLIRTFALDPATILIADNGPGVREEDAPYIFEPFYSGKGDEGKGLGLYIARQNGLRSGFHVDVAKSPPDGRALEGASFVVTFNSEVKS